MNIGAISGITDDQNDDIMAFLILTSAIVMATIEGVGLGCVLDTGAEASLIPSDVIYQQLELKVGPLRELPKPALLLDLRRQEYQY